MAGPENLPDGLREALAELARADLDGLLAEARGEARASVKALLRDAYANALLEQAGRAGEPATPPQPVAAPPPPAREAPTGDARWVYCVVPAERQVPPDLVGVSERGRPRLIAAGRVAALVSDVPLDEFGEAALRENLNDLNWLERTVRAHEAVLEATLGGGAVVPMRVCTIYRGDEQVQEMLEERGPLFLDTLSRLAGKAEWGVKVVADRRRIEEHVRGDDANEEIRVLSAEAAAKPEGGSYIARKKLDALVRERADRIVSDVLRETHARLEEWAAASVALPAQNRELAGYQGEMVFNAAYLVEDARAAAFGDLVHELAEQHAASGLTLELTGPWPAYNFAATGAGVEVAR